MIYSNPLCKFSIICFPQKINWLQERDLWCFDYTFVDGLEVKDEPLMPEATELINRLLAIKYKGETVDKIQITFSKGKINRFDLCLEYLEPADDGSHYVVQDGNDYLNMKVWLCPVFDQFFPKGRPKKLFVKIIKLHSSDNFSKRHRQIFRV
tara:strand:- start:278 stop:733 length:456 start_codon:yes stop_codon:yes gene_type:complete